MIHIIINQNCDKPIYKKICEKKEELNVEMMKAIEHLKELVEGGYCHRNLERGI